MKKTIGDWIEEILISENGVGLTDPDSHLYKLNEKEKNLVELMRKDGEFDFLDTLLLSFGIGGITMLGIDGVVNPGYGYTLASAGVAALGSGVFCGGYGHDGIGRWSTKRAFYGALTGGLPWLGMTGLMVWVF